MYGVAGISKEIMYFHVTRTKFFLVVTFLISVPVLTPSCLGRWVTGSTPAMRLQLQVFNSLDLQPVSDVGVTYNGWDVGAISIPPTGKDGFTVFVLPQTGCGGWVSEFGLFSIDRRPRIKFTLTFEKDGYWKEEVKFPDDFPNAYQEQFLEKKVLLVPKPRLNSSGN